jgi:hypothetical protein
MGVVVKVTIEGDEEVLARLKEIQEKARENLVKLTADFAKDTEADWQEVTPRRSGRLQEADVTVPAGLSFTMENDVYYYPFVDTGHRTPAGWRTKHGYRPAKHRSYVEGRLMTERAVDYIEENLTEKLSHFLDGS